MFGRLFDGFVNFLLRLICKIDDEELVRKMPYDGPLLMIFNHINFIEAPLFYLLMRPRRVYGVMKVEISRVPVLKTITERWGGIPLKRGAPPSAAFRRVSELLSEGAIIGLAPEGTRSRDGVLGKGNPGVVTLALQNDVPIVPVAHFGTQHLGRNVKRFRRTPIVFRVGQPFKLVPPEKLTKESRRELTHDMMVQLAALLPEEMRGEYSDISSRDGKSITLL